MVVQIVKPDVKITQVIDVDIVAVAAAVTIPIEIVACEVTMPIEITGSKIQLPIDIQGSFVAVPVDIQAQVCAIDIDICAQTIGNLAIDITAQTIGELSFKCGDVSGNVDITISKAQKVGVFMESEWESKQGNEKDQFKESGPLAWSVSVNTVDYAPPAGKDLYVTGMGFSIYPANAEDYDHHLWGEAVLFCPYLGNEVA
ncbi:unnamed protein product, partial [marine sediment metagenome]